jgi:hypothetical protein
MSAGRLMRFFVVKMLVLTEGMFPPPVYPVNPLVVDD